MTKVFISRILINFYSINHINFFTAKTSSEAVASLPQWKLRHCMVMIDNAQKDVKIFKKSLKIPKGVIRIRNSKKNRQHNDQQKKDKRTNNVLQNIHIRLQIE